jgi:hypothetical protein
VDGRAEGWKISFFFKLFESDHQIGPSFLLQSSRWVSVDRMEAWSEIRRQALRQTLG